MLAALSTGKPPTVVLTPVKDSAEGTYEALRRELPELRARYRRVSLRRQRAPSSGHRASPDAPTRSRASHTLRALGDALAPA